MYKVHLVIFQSGYSSHPIHFWFAFVSAFRVDPDINITQCLTQLQPCQRGPKRRQEDEPERHNRPELGSLCKQRQVIRNRCSGGRPGHELDRHFVWWVDNWVTKETQWERRVYERPPAAFSETDDLEGRSLYPPCDCHRLRQHSGSGKIWEEFSGGNMWCCWTDWAAETLYPLSAAHQVVRWGWWRLSDYFVWPQANCGQWVSFKLKHQTKLNSTTLTEYALILFPCNIVYR